MDHVLNLLFFIILPSPSLLIHITTGDHLVESLCNNNLSNITLSLHHLFTYNVTFSRACVINNIDTVTIESNTTDIVTVFCVKQEFDDPQSTVAFAFLNTSVIIKNVEFTGCGSNLKNFDSALIRLINSSSIYFTSSHSALFVFINVSVSISVFRIRHYYGFAIISMDLRSSEFTNMLITENAGIVVASKNDGVSIGSGLLLLFSSMRYIGANVSLLNCTFFSDANYINSSNGQCIDTESDEKDNLIFQNIKNAAALTIIFNQHNSSGSIVSIKQSNFSYNFGSYCSGLMILMINSTKGKVEISQNTVFGSNTNLFQCPGNALILYMIGGNTGYSSPLEVRDVYFFKENEILTKYLPDSFNSGAVYIKIFQVSDSIDIVFRNVTFENNHAQMHGACFLVMVHRKSVSQVPKTQVVMDAITASLNAIKFKDVQSPIANIGIFVFLNVDKIIINGSNSHPSVFSHNCGSVIQTYNSEIHLKGYVKFISNHAKFGAAFNLRESLLYFDDNLNVEMINNSAEISGGAIYIINTVVDVIPKCALQLSSNQHLAVSNNFAIKNGNLMYAFPIYNCYSLHERKLIVTTSYYMKRFNFSNSTLNRNNILDISSRVSSYNYCGNGAFYKSCFPGEKIFFNLSALDYSNNTVYSIFEVFVEKNDGQNSWNQSDLSISNSQKYQYLNESKNGTCTKIEISIFYHGSFKEKANGLVYVYISSLQANVIRKLTLSLNACPPGFELMKSHGICKCSSAVQKFFCVNHLESNCDINTLSISWPFIRVNKIWLGNYFNNKSTFAIGGDCPLHFCSPVLDYSKAKFDHHSGTFFLVKPLDLSQANSFCRPHRKGVYCGECEEGYSVVFGSGDCMKCSNWWLLTIALYALAGPLLIYVLYVLKLTLASGTMNGIIFYAQAANVNILPFIVALPSNEISFTQFLEIFLSSINLNLGFPLCFYDGMNEFWKSVLSLVFPIYLLAIVVAVIFLSRYSVWVSNKTSNCSVQVLVTVVHLSLSNLLSAITDVFKKAKLYLDSTKGVKEQLVWSKNGDIAYGSYNHALLVAVTLIVVIGFCIPCIFDSTNWRKVHYQISLWK